MFDVVVIGSGMAGISLASELSINLSVCVLEKENLLSYHSTGRSMAFYIESYGNETVRKLTTASKSFFKNFENIYSDRKLLNKRGVLHIANNKQGPNIKHLYDNLCKTNNNFYLLNKSQTLDLLPCLKDEYVKSSVYDIEASEIDVNLMYDIFLKKLKKNNGSIIKDIQIKDFVYTDNSWEISSNKNTVRSKILVNAAGAWCDEVAIQAKVKKINLVPKKRTIFCFKPKDIQLQNNWPLATDVDENFYFKVENETVIASPADETPMSPQDAQPDELDIAIGVERIKNSTKFQFNSITNKWAGLRSFVEDKTPVIGFDKNINNFFWFAGQGGFGIQTSPVLAKIASNMILGKDNEYFEKEFQIDLNSLNVRRFNSI